jgi:hypothetical protein
MKRIQRSKISTKAIQERHSKSLIAVIVIQKVNPMTRGRINPAWRDKSRYFINHLPRKSQIFPRSHFLKKISLRLATHPKRWHEF